MFKYVLISMAVVPVLLGVLAAGGQNDKSHRTMLRVMWFSYSIVWFAVLYWIRRRWT